MSQALLKYTASVLIRIRLYIFIRVTYNQSRLWFLKLSNTKILLTIRALKILPRARKKEAFFYVSVLSIN